MLSIFIFKDKKIKLLFLKKKSLYIPALIELKTHHDVQKAIVISDIECIKLKLCFYVSNPLFLAGFLNIFAIELLLYIYSNIIEAKKIVKLKPLFFIYNIFAIIKKIG